MQVVAELSQAFALCSATDEATVIRDDVSFFQALQAALNKKSSESHKSPEQIDAAIRQLVFRAIATEGEIIEVFTAASLKKPDISILCDQFLAEIRGLVKLPNSRNPIFSLRRCPKLYARARRASL